VEEESQKAKEKKAKRNKQKSKGSKQQKKKPTKKKRSGKKNQEQEKEKELKRIGADPNRQLDEDGDSPLHIFARRGTFEEIVTLLVHPTTDISLCNHTDELPLSCVPDLILFEKKVLSLSLSLSLSLYLSFSALSSSVAFLYLSGCFAACKR